MRRGDHAMDVIVIGGGVNGLVAAAWLARQKLETVVLERQPEVGGAAATSELAPGFHVPALSHALGPVHRDVIRALRLDHTAGLDLLVPDPALTSLGPDGQVVSFHRDAVLTAGSINRISPRDAGAWRQFLQTTHRVAAVLGALDRQPPPPLDDASLRDWWRLVGAGRRARALGRRDRARLARWMPMAVADLVDEWFESDLVRAPPRRARCSGRSEVHDRPERARRFFSGSPKTRCPLAAASRPAAVLALSRAQSPRAPRPMGPPSDRRARRAGALEERPRRPASRSTTASS